MADVELENNLESEFGEFGIDIEGNLGVLEKCMYFNVLVLLVLCRLFHFEHQNCINTKIK